MDQVNGIKNKQTLKIQEDKRDTKPKLKRKEKLPGVKDSHRV